MRLTAEVRWIWPGEIPDSVRAWFDALGGPLPDPAERTDRYLVPTAPGGLNVKWREGGLEVKRCAARRGVGALAEGVRGAVEVWSKWRFPLGDAAERPGAEAWLDVAKRRRVRAFLFDGGTLREAPDDEALARACEVELGRLRVGGRRYATVCYEAFDESAASHGGAAPDAADALVSLLRRTAAATMRERPPRSLMAERSTSYADWLYALRRGA